MVSAMKKNFNELLRRAQTGDKGAAEQIFEEYMPLIQKYSYIRHQIDEDLLGELYLASHKCIMRFHVNRADYEDFLLSLKKSEEKP